MGIEIIIGAVAAAASVVTGVAQMGAAKKATAAQKESNNIQNAQQQNAAADSRRQAIREARVRQAQILQGAENAGVGDSSGASGAVGVIGTNLGSTNAQSLGMSTAAAGINRSNQKAADYNFKASEWGAFGSIFTNALGAFQTKGTQAALQ